MFVIRGIQYFCRNSEIREFGLPRMMNQNIACFDIPVYLLILVHVVQGSQNMFHYTGDLVLTDFYFILLQCRFLFLHQVQNRAM